jgi:hypothetical protein
MVTAPTPDLRAQPDSRRSLNVAAKMIGIEERQRRVERQHDDVGQCLGGTMRDWRPPNGCAGDAFKDDSVGTRYAPDSMLQRQHYANGHALLDRRRDDGRRCGDDQLEFAERLAGDRGHLSEPDDPEAYKQRNHRYDAMRAPAWR